MCATWCKFLGAQLKQLKTLAAPKKSESFRCCLTQVVINFTLNKIDVFIPSSCSYSTLAQSKDLLLLIIVLEIEPM